jgi:protein gp37
MSDLFHKAVPEEFVRAVFDVMARATQDSQLLLG